MQVVPLRRKESFLDHKQRKGPMLSGQKKKRKGRTETNHWGSDRRPKKRECGSAAH